MIRPLFSAAVLFLGSSLALVACASSEDGDGGGGVGGTAGAGTGGAAGSASGGSNSGGTTNTGGTGGNTTDGGGAVGGTSTVDAGPATTVSGQLVDLLDNTKPVVGVQVCIFEDNSTPCVSTDANGDFTLTGVPSGVEILLEFTKSDYFPTLVTLTTDANPMDLGQLLAPSKFAVNFLGLAVGATVDPTKGQLLFMTLTPAAGGGGLTGEANVVATLDPKTGVGPYYFDANQQPDKTLTATTTTGAGVYANVDPGYAELTLSSFSKTCTRMPTAWAGSTPTASKVRVVAGYLTGGAAIQCPN